MVTAVHRREVSSSGVFTTIVFPPSHYRLMGDDAVHLWRGLAMASLASRVRLVPFAERTLSHRRDGADEDTRIVNDSADAQRWAGREHLTDHTCRGRYTPQRCPTPREFAGEFLATK